MDFYDTYTPAQTGYLNHILGVDPRHVPVVILPIEHAAERPDPALRPKKPLAEVNRFATNLHP